MTALTTRATNRVRRTRAADSSVSRSTVRTRAWRNRPRDLAQPAGPVKVQDIDPFAQPGHGLREPGGLELAVRRHAASVPCPAVS